MQMPVYDSSASREIRRWTYIPLWSVSSPIAGPEAFILWNVVRHSFWRTSLRNNLSFFHLRPPMLIMPPFKVEPCSTAEKYLTASTRKALPWTKLTPVVPVTATFLQYLRKRGDVRVWIHPPTQQLIDASTQWRHSGV